MTQLRGIQASWDGGGSPRWTGRDLGEFTIENTTTNDMRNSHGYLASIFGSFENARVGRYIL